MHSRRTGYIVVRQPNNRCRRAVIAAPVHVHITAKGCKMHPHVANRCASVCVCELVGGISVWFWLEFKRFTNTCALLWQLHLSRILFGLSGKTVLSATPGGCATMFLSHLLSTANVESWTNKNVPQSRGFLKQDTWSQHKMFHLFTWTAPCYPCARRCSSSFFYSTPASCQTELFVLLCSQLYLSFHFFLGFCIARFLFISLTRQKRRTPRKLSI